MNATQHLAQRVTPWVDDLDLGPAETTLRPAVILEPKGVRMISVVQALAVADGTWTESHQRISGSWWAQQPGR